MGPRPNRTPRLASLASRLVATAVLLVALVSLLIGLTTTLFMRDHLTDQLDRQVVDAYQRESLGEGSRGRPGLRAIPGTLRVDLVEGRSPAGYVLEDSRFDHVDYEALRGEALAALAGIRADDRPRSVDVPGHGSYRLLARRVEFVAGPLGDQPTPGTLAVGLPTDSVDDTITRLVWGELLLGALAVGATAVLGRLVVRRQLAPLRAVADTAHEVATLPLASGEVDLSPRVPDPDEATEAGRVGAALNRLLAHVESSLSARHRSEQQVRQFVADASHELRTPLTTIRGYAELARRTPDDAAALSGSLAKVSTEADRMAGLVDDLLLLARLDAGRALDRGAVDLTRLLLEAVGDARVVAPGHRWRLELPDEPLEIEGDEQRLHQAVTNLLANARQHTPDGTTVTVSAAHTPSGGVEVVVADDGPGFPPELAAHAFERFTRGDASRTRQSGGAGLGLSIVAAIVRAHGGEAHLDSRPGATRVRLRLPATG